QVGETQVNGDAASLLLRQSIRINASQRFDQRAFAVIDVACGREDEMGVVHPSLRARCMAAITSLSCCGKIVRRSSLKREPATYPITGGVACRRRAAKS